VQAPASLRSDRLLRRFFADLDACVEATVLGDTEGCQFDSRRARECREALKWSCRKIGERYDEVVNRCNAIWSCDTGTVVTGGPGLL